MHGEDLHPITPHLHLAQFQAGFLTPSLREIVKKLRQRGIRDGGKIRHLLM